MSLNEDLVQPTSDSFWEVGKYSRTVKRIDNGYKLCDNLRQLIDQRSEIEKNYAKQLSQWSKKWNDFLDRGPEYGTVQGSWRGLLSEADSLADLHNLVAENLMSKVYASIKAWQKENYHKSMMHFKETKEQEDSFKKAQKPWEKRYTKVLQSKKDYHTACRAEKSTANQENNARGDSAVSPDQLRKIQEKLRKCQAEVEATRDKYDAALNDLNSYNAKYMEDMNEVFSKCQDFEKKRVEYFKKTMFEIHQAMDLSCEPRFSQLYTNLHNTIGQVDSDKDLRWWSHNHGCDMAMNWPVFEEYSPDLQTISKKEKKNSQIGGDGITITSIRHKPDTYNPTPIDQQPSYNTQRSSTGSNVSNQQQQQQQQQQPAQRKKSFDGFPSLRKKSKDHSSVKNKDKKIDTANSTNESKKPSPAIRGSKIQPKKPHVIETNVNNVNSVSSSQHEKQQLSKKLSYDESLNPFGDDDDQEIKEEEPHVYQSIEEARNQHNNVPTSTPATENNVEETLTDGNPFGDDDDEIVEDSPQESPRGEQREGIPVRALYDYKVTEDDELPLKAGDVFVKLSEEDELGWCKGLKDGREGLYPANYVEPV